MNLTLIQLAAAAKIGWAAESNWTRLPLFILYSATRPLAVCLILYFLFRAITGDPSNQSQFVAVYVGSAFFTMVISITAALSWVIIEDREHYQLIRYVYITPMRLFVYMIGRALPILGISLSSLLIIWLFGWLVLSLPIGPAHIDWLLMAPTFVLGLVTTGALGLLFAGFVLVTARHSMLLAEGTGAMFLLVCGVIYPVDIMPRWIAWLADVLPMTYWMEMVRRSFGLTDLAVPFSKTMAGWSDGGLLAVFAAATAALVAVAVWSFRRLEHAAKSRGKLDQATNY